MAIAKLLNPYYSGRVIGIDCSTNSVAFAVFEEGELVDFGEFPFLGSTVYDRMKHARQVMDQNASRFADLKYLAIEKTIKVRSVSVAIKMGYFAGIVMSKFMESGAVVKEITPLQWQKHIGNGTFSTEEKRKLRNNFPGRKASWYTAKQREIRKQRTIDWVKDTFGKEVSSDNIADAIGIAYYASGGG